MKNFILSIGVFMLALLMVGLYLFENQTQSLPLTPDEQIARQLAENRSFEPAELRPVSDEGPAGYSLQNEQLNVTFDSGTDWVMVPVEKEQLFEGEYSGDAQELIPGSYILEAERTGFLYVKRSDQADQTLRFLYSLDQGKTWQDSAVWENFPSLRFRKVAFLNEQFGYVIASGERTMSQESVRVYLTHDGGQTWTETAASGGTRLVSDGGFVDESTGFLSFGILSPREPDLRVTQDGGDSWTEAVFHMPAEYEGVFVAAEVPYAEEDHLAVLVNQGTTGDYKGGEVKGKFLSTDQGSTWDFEKEAVPDEE